MEERVTNTAFIEFDMCVIEIKTAFIADYVFVKLFNVPLYSNFI